MQNARLILRLGLRSKVMANILILHGPNLNLLGSREPELYGNLTLPALNAALETLANELGHTLSISQSNAEHILIDRIHQCQQDETQFIIINPAALTHTSVALRDALIAVDKPFIEVHISNIYRREAFRQHSYFSDIALGVISGLGTEGYQCALRYAHHYLTRSQRSNVPLWTCEKSVN
jgi:3-dehydroquinate dehydratase-2